MNVLHLSSWYPNKTSEQAGDFIQRHVEAIADLMQAYVIHVVKDQTISANSLKSATQKNNLTESVIYYRSAVIGVPLIDKLVSLRTYRNNLRTEILSHISSNGKPDLVHVHVAMRAGLGALWVLNEFKIPFIVTEHWSGYYKTVTDNYFSRDFTFRYFTRRILKNASYVTAVSSDLMKTLERIFNLKRSAVIFNVVDTRRFYPNHRKLEKFTFIHISNMHPVKNIGGIFNVLAKLKTVRDDWQITMVGEIEPKYQELALRLGISEHIEWTGCIGHSAVPAAIQKAHVLVMFSNHENLSCVVCESLCCGLPVVATAVGGLPEIINGQNGLLCKPGDENSLFTAILTILEKYPLYDKGEIAAQAAQLFAKEIIAKQFLSLYNDVLTRS